MVRFLPLVGMTDAPDGDTGGNAAAKPPRSLHLPVQVHMSFRPKGGISQHKANQPLFQAKNGGIIISGVKKKLIYEGLKFDLENFHRY